MRSNDRHERLIHAALARLPDWQPPPGFATRVVLAATERVEWAPLLLRGLGIAACVSVAAWLVAELLYAGLLSLAAQNDSGALLGWVLGAGALVFAGRYAMPALFRR